VQHASQNIAPQGASACKRGSMHIIAPSRRCDKLSHRCRELDHYQELSSWAP
jgi:hypothetical protein